MLSLTSLFFTYGGPFGNSVTPSTEWMPQAALAPTSRFAVPHRTPIILVGTDTTAQKLRTLLLSLEPTWPADRVQVEAVIGLSSVADTREIDDALRHLNAFDWLLFFSRPSCEFFTARASALGITFDPQQGPKIATVGQATAETARELGYVPTVVADGGTASDLIDLLCQRPDVAGSRILVPRSAAGEEAVLAPLHPLAKAVRTVVTYDNRPLPIAEAAWRAYTDPEMTPTIAFLSSSAVTALWSGLPLEIQAALAERAAMFALGPTTAETLAQVRWPVAATAIPPTLATLAATLRTAAAAERPPVLAPTDPHQPRA